MWHVWFGALILIGLPIGAAGILLFKMRNLRIVQHDLMHAAGCNEMKKFEEIAKVHPEEHELIRHLRATSDSLREKTNELIHAKKELEKFTGFLEKRVEARTRELKETQDKLKAATAEIDELRRPKS